MDNNKQREIRNKSSKKPEITLIQGKFNKEINDKSQKRTNHNPIQINVITPVSNYIDKKIESNTPKKSTFTPIILKDLTAYKTNPDSRIGSGLFPQPISDEYKYIQESTNNKITGVLYVLIIEYEDNRRY